MKKTAALVTAFLFCTISLFAQQKPFWNDIQAFKKQDSINPPPQQAILLIGSSSFTKWHDVQNYFPNYTIVNRAFGGSTLPDVIGYVNDIVFPYHPKQVVVFCGDNDLASSDTITASTVINRFKNLFQIIRAQLPNTSIVYVSIKPSPSRQKLMPKQQEANNEIKKFLKKQGNTAFVDVYHKMLNTDGSIMSDIFLEDQLHMNAKGYTIWQKEIQPVLKK
ncbi:GDSL-type esterase/lipase family protein [Pinibacter aurantiacus]|uniref:G-D-S-L family lipolytic protein n=1 Tax=Pinibacter aurantiacus TaxID=2851599 RepID=A0A9E2W4D9_9BACT|nr:GDSL-type esterase/lipase family protein [Pinibacter aurantiacus]MBV4357724.1 G-D-S-L family lipolytic protein [Pinibacter aurantiacus]